MQRVFALFEERFLSFGWGSRALWLIVAAVCYIPDPTPNPEARPSPWKTTVADRVAGLIRKVCTFQVGKDPSVEYDEALFAKYVRHIRQTLEPTAAEEARAGETASAPLSIDGLTVRQASAFRGSL